MWTDMIWMWYHWNVWQWNLWMNDILRYSSLIYRNHAAALYWFCFVVYLDNFGINEIEKNYVIICWLWSVSLISRNWDEFRCFSTERTRTSAGLHWNVWMDTRTHSLAYTQISVRELLVTMTVQLWWALNNNLFCY